MDSDSEKQGNTNDQIRLAEQASQGVPSYTLEEGETSRVVEQSENVTVYAAGSAGDSPVTSAPLAASGPNPNLRSDFADAAPNDAPPSYVLEEGAAGPVVEDNEMFFSGEQGLTARYITEKLEEVTGFEELSQQSVGAEFNEHCLEAQKLMARLNPDLDFGSADGGPDGYFGPATTKAVEQVQEDLGMEVTGIITTEMMLQMGHTLVMNDPSYLDDPSFLEEVSEKIDTLYGFDELSQQSVGGEFNEDCLHAQELMARLNPDLDFGSADGKPDGYFGPATKQAVEQVQEDLGMEVTGTITPEVMLQMQSELTVRYVNAPDNLNIEAAAEPVHEDPGQNWDEFEADVLENGLQPKQELQAVPTDDVLDPNDSLTIAGTGANLADGVVPEGAIAARIDSQSGQLEKTPDDLAQPELQQQTSSPLGMGVA